MSETPLINHIMKKANVDELKAVMILYHLIRLFGTNNVNINCIDDLLKHSEEDGYNDPLDLIVETCEALGIYP